MRTLRHVVEFTNSPLHTGWTNMETVACVATHSELIDFFEGELRCSIDPALTEEIQDILESAEWPTFTPHYRISTTHGRRVREFVDQ